MPSSLYYTGQTSSSADENLLDLIEVSKLRLLRAALKLCLLGFKLKERKFGLDLWKKFYSIRAMIHWHRLPSEVGGECPITGDSQGQAGGTLST